MICRHRCIVAIDVLLNAHQSHCPLLHHNPINPFVQSLHLLHYSTRLFIDGALLARPSLLSRPHRKASFWAEGAVFMNYAIFLLLNLVLMEGLRPYSRVRVEVCLCPGGLFCWN